MDKKLNYFSAIGFLSPYIKKYAKNFVVFHIGWFLDTVINVILPALLGVLIDEIVYYQNRRTFVLIGAIILALILFLCVLYFFIYAQHQYLMSMFKYSIKMDLFKHWQKKCAEDITNRSTGDTLTLIQNYSSDCLHFMIRNVVHFSNGIFKLIILVILLFSIHWKIGIFILIAAPFSVYVNIYFGKKNKSDGQKIRNETGSYNGWLYELIGFLPTVRTLCAQHKVNQEFREKNEKLFALNIHSDVVRISSSNLIDFINLVIKLVIFGFAGYLAMSYQMTVGMLLVVISYYSLLTEQVWYTSNSYIDAQKRVSFIQSISDFLKTPTEKNFDGCQDLVVKKGEILFQDVSFAYKHSDPVLRHLNLRIAGGKRTAIVGVSGSGKTTLAHLLLAFYRPDEGSVYIDGTELRNCTIRSVRSEIGLVAQDVLLFDASVLENIRLGKQDASEEEILDACEKAGLSNFIGTLPQGLHTIIGPNGQEVSGGQAQRIAIARIYLKNPSIVIFDEATSSVDDQTERQIHEAWSRVLQGKTALVIAHKISAVRLCDYVAVLKDGKIHAFGKTQDIMEKDGEFKKIFALPEEEVVC